MEGGGDETFFTLCRHQDGSYVFYLERDNYKVLKFCLSNCSNIEISASLF